MSSVTLEAQTRAVQGKGASRRLRRLGQRVPAIVYGSDTAPQLLSLPQHKIQKALENEAIYTSVFDLVIDGTAQQVILKDIQRHPYKPVILHLDFQRVSDKDVLVRFIPLHFLHGEDCPGAKEGGVVHHALSQVEVCCEARYLPEFIEVDLSRLELDQTLHLSDLKLPAHVTLATALTADNNQPLASAHLSRAAEALEAEEADHDAADQAADAQASDEGAAE